MAVVAVTPTRLTAGTFSATLPISGGVVATSTTDGWSIALGSRGTVEGLLIIVLDDGATSTITVKKGDRNPGPAQLADLGDKTQAFAASETRWISLQPGRHEQDDNTITVVPSTTGAKIICFLLPTGIGGGSAIA